MAKGRGSNHRPDWAHFTGYGSPNYTQVPDELFDEHLAFLSGGELKVLLYIIRRTFGFKKDRDSISLSQMLQGIQTRDGRILDFGVGLSKPTLLQALRSLVEKNLIITERRRSAERGDEPTVYMLRIHGGQDRGKDPEPPVVKKVNQGGGKEIVPGAWPNNLTTQDTVLQETEEQDIDISNIRMAQPSQIRSQETKVVRTQSTEYGDLTTAAKTPRVPKLSTNPSQRSLAREKGTVSDTSESSSTGVSSVGEVLARRTRKDRSTGPTRPQKPYPEDRQQVFTYIQDFSRELGDEAPLASSVSRAYNLQNQSGVPMEAFVSLMYEARGLTQENSANVTKHQAGESASFGYKKNKMAYFFATLENLIADRYGGSKEINDTQMEGQ